MREPIDVRERRKTDLGVYDQSDPLNLIVTVPRSMIGVTFKESESPNWDDPIIVNGRKMTLKEAADNYDIRFKNVNSLLKTIALQF